MSPSCKRLLLQNVNVVGNLKGCNVVGRRWHAVALGARNALRVFNKHVCILLDMRVDHACVGLCRAALLKQAQSAATAVQILHGVAAPQVFKFALQCP